MAIIIIITMATQIPHKFTKICYDDAYNKPGYRRLEEKQNIRDMSVMIMYFISTNNTQA